MFFTSTSGSGVTAAEADADTGADTLSSADAVGAADIAAGGAAALSGTSAAPRSIALGRGTGLELAGACDEGDSAQAVQSASAAKHEMAFSVRTVNPAG